jgi:catechol 2,3-dioxygenase-like lactoylglutathione lyase family enzyme
MITGLHTLLYSADAEAARRLFADILALPSVDAGGGWRIFALPPAELAVHPSDAPQPPELYFMCDDIERTMAELRAKGVEFTQPVQRERWGLRTAFRIPGGGEMGMYEPLHPVAIEMPRAKTGD